MTNKTTGEIAALSRTAEHETLQGLMNYYGKTNLMEISEQQALAFLEMLQNGKIKVDINGEVCR